MYTTTNAPESAHLSSDDLQVFEAARVAAGSLSKTFDLWVVIARAVELARVKADRIGTRPAFQRILEQQGLAPALGNTWNSQKSTANKLLAILDHLPEVQQWRATLNRHQQISWSAPTTLYKHCPVFAVDRPAKDEDSLQDDDDVERTKKETVEDALHDKVQGLRDENLKLREAMAKRCDVDLLHSDVELIIDYFRTGIIEKYKALRIRDGLIEIYPLRDSDPRNATATVEPTKAKPPASGKATDLTEEELEAFGDVVEDVIGAKAVRRRRRSKT
jgi:hypothetical protein